MHRHILCLLLAFSPLSFAISCNPAAYTEKTPILVQYVQGDFQAAVTAAAQAKRPILVDVYTTWCGPCKMMDKAVFHNKTVADYLNAHFICIKIDAETPDGAVFQRDYNVTGYPTLLVFDSNANLRETSIGSMDKTEFLAMVKKYR
jgi:thiol:disulfide interchange protein